MMLTREMNVYMAKLAEEAERYEEMAEFMTAAAGCGGAGELTVEERNLLSVAYRKLIEALRATRRRICRLERKEESHRVASMRKYRSKIEAELRSVCRHILNLLDRTLISSASSGDSKVFYLKMKGDFHRYLAEFETGDDLKAAAALSLCAYEEAQGIAYAKLAPTDPIRLRLTLSFSLLYQDIFNLTDRAYNLAKQAYDEAMDDVFTLDEESYKATVSMILLLRENFSEWKNNGTDETKEALKQDEDGLDPKKEKQPTSIIWTCVETSLRNLGVILCYCCLKKL